MKHAWNWWLPACALALALGGCGSIEHLSASPALMPEPVPEPPPWNSIEMMWMDTEIVRAESPGGEPVAGNPLASLS